MKILVIFTLLLLTTQGQAQRLKQLFSPRVAPRLNKIIPVNPANIDIVRDKWGVPHIFAPTDREVAYGLAYAMAEDGFAAMQDLILAAKGRTGEYLGASGAAVDFLYQTFKIDEIVERDFNTSFSPEYLAVLDGYVQGLNKYALQHPKEQLLKDVFPITTKDLAKGYALALCVVCGIDKDIQAIVNNTIPLSVDGPKGSNGYAFSPAKTKDNSTYLCVNSHQPLEGAFSWKEAHVCSQEGWNMLGGVFPLGCTPFIGTNENLGWVHTINKTDLVDVFQLKMNPNSPLQYELDGRWQNLEVRTIALKVKIVGGVKVKVKRQVYWSEFGPTLKNDKGFFSIRFPAMYAFDAIEQWYWMNKATNYEEFQKCLDIQTLPRMNIIYADKNENIFYIDNGLFPKRTKGYNWRKTLLGNKSEQLWKEFYPIAELPQVKNPKSGYIFNTNNSPFNCTGDGESPKASNFSNDMGFYLYENNRSIRFKKIIKERDKWDFEQFKSIKMDTQLPTDSNYFDLDVNLLLELDPTKYPDLKDQILQLKNWDRNADTNNTTTALYNLTVLNILIAVKFNSDYQRDDIQASEELIVQCLTKTTKHLKKYFKTTIVPLKMVQKHVRGNKEYAIDGQIDVLRAFYLQPYKDGKYRTFIGDGYMMFIKYSKDKKYPYIETIHPYGTSEHAENPHYNDQMELFVNKKAKVMTLDKTEIYKNAEKIYSPQ